MFYWFVSVLVRAFMALVARLEVSGLEHTPRSGPVIVVANHLHYSDAPILGAVLPRKVIFMAKRELFRMLFVGLIVQAYEAFAVWRGRGDARAIRKATQVLSQGRALGMFPEGTRSKRGVLQQGRPGAAMIALRTGAPILPIGISGTKTFLQWPRVLSRPRVVITIGKPFRAADVPALSSIPSDRRQQSELTSEIMRRIAELLPPEQRGVYGVDQAAESKPVAVGADVATSGSQTDDPSPPGAS